MKTFIPVCIVNRRALILLLFIILAQLMHAQTIVADIGRSVQYPHSSNDANQIRANHRLSKCDMRQFQLGVEFNLSKKNENQTPKWHLSLHIGSYKKDQELSFYHLSKFTNEIVISSYSILQEGILLNAKGAYSVPLSNNLWFDLNGGVQIHKVISNYSIPNSQFSDVDLKFNVSSKNMFIRPYIGMSTKIAFLEKHMILILMDFSLSRTLNNNIRVLEVYNDEFIFHSLSSTVFSHYFRIGYAYNI